MLKEGQRLVVRKSFQWLLTIFVVSALCWGPSEVHAQDSVPSNAEQVEAEAKLGILTETFFPLTPFKNVPFKNVLSQTSQAPLRAGNRKPVCDP